MKNEKSQKLTKVANIENKTNKGNATLPTGLNAAAQAVIIAANARKKQLPKSQPEKK